MGMLPLMVGEFFVVTEPEMRFSQSGMAIVKARAKSDNSRKQQDGSYSADKEVFVSLTGFRELAERFANDVAKTSNVRVTGRFHEAKYQTKDGADRTELVLTMDSFEPIIRDGQQGGSRGGNQGQRGNQSNGGQNGRQQGNQRQQQGNQQQSQDNGWPADDGGEPPF